MQFAELVKQMKGSGWKSVSPSTNQLEQQGIEYKLIEQRQWEIIVTKTVDTNKEDTTVDAIIHYVCNPSATDRVITISHNIATLSLSTLNAITQPYYNYWGKQE
jgi:hypothetical protein